MATDERNFRSAYYEKVGFRSVEEKKSLEILLKDKPLDRGKLKQFCIRFSVPGTYRNLVWKLLLGTIQYFSTELLIRPFIVGVVHVHTECHGFIMDQRKQEYNDLLRALNVLKVIDQNTPKSQLFLFMWVLQSGNFTLEVNLFHEKGFLPIVQSFIQFFDDDVDIYWLARSFYNNVKKFEHEIPKLVECSHNLLEKEDAAYHKLLVSNDIMNNLPLSMWFSCCFAGVLNESALAK